MADRTIGVDIQEIRSFSWDVAKRVCSIRELEELTACEDRDRCFTRMWTLKESYGKMNEAGILYDMKNLDIIEEDKRIGVLDKGEFIIAICLEK